MTDYLKSYQEKIYYLHEYRGRQQNLTGARELFNYKYSSLMNVIERYFEALKSRFFILKMMPPYPLHKQSMIVIVACIIHNFIRSEIYADVDFIEYDDDGRNIKNEIEVEEIEKASPSMHTSQSQRSCEMVQLRDSIANAIAITHDVPTI